MCLCSVCAFSTNTVSQCYSRFRPSRRCIRKESPAVSSPDYVRTSVNHTHKMEHWRTVATFVNYFTTFHSTPSGQFPKHLIILLPWFCYVSQGSWQRVRHENLLSVLNTGFKAMFQYMPVRFNIIIKHITRRVVFLSLFCSCVCYIVVWLNIRRVTVKDVIIFTVRISVNWYKGRRVCRIFKHIKI